MTVYLKILGPNKESIHGGNAKWHKGRWMPEQPVRMCESGYHLIEPFQLLDWRQENCTVWLAEGRGEHQTAADKSCWAQARILRQLHTPTSREVIIYAADCAEHVLPIFEDAYPNDDRPRKAIEAARAWAAAPSEKNRANAASAAEAAHAANAAYADYAAYAAANSSSASYAAHAAYAAAAANAATYAAEAAHAAAASYAAYAAYADDAATYAAEAAHAAARARVTYAAEAAHAERKWQSDRMMALLTGSL